MSTGHEGLVPDTNVKKAIAPQPDSLCFAWKAWPLCPGPLHSCPLLEENILQQFQELHVGE